MANTFTNLLVHVVFSTKNREPIITETLKPDLEDYIGGILRSEGHRLLEIGGMPDHVHILLKMRPDVAISDLIRVVKSNSSKWANGKSTNFAWQSGFGAFTVSESQFDVVRDYIVNQAEHHKRISFQQEYVAFLRRHGVEYDERYLWG